MPIKMALLMGMLTKDNKKMENIPEYYRSMYSQERYKFLLEAPFNISSKCCNVMKKQPFKAYERRTGRKPITAQMADESRLRTQQWMNNGCNGFDMKHPISNPMSFWTKQDVLLYAKINNLDICSVYGEIVKDYKDMGQVEGQLSFADLMQSSEQEIFELGKVILKTTGCDRTGCVFCGYGCHLEKQRPNRFELIDIMSNPNLRDYCFRGGAFDETDGLWKPDDRGLGYWFVIKWINIHGGFNIYIPEYERYEKEYGNEETRKYLEEE